ncbi:MAG: ATP-binding cassette domain-containing protein [Candidatus Roizmanbacteria bacterium]|nr:ATP-binding cassette domain-containing protein [Candidatus Roizmanbacteria bacterium]
MITVKNVTKIYKSHIRQNNILKDIFFRTFKEHIAVKNISLDIKENELVGFIGPNGAGKTSTLKMLAGILYPTSGSLSVLGYTPFDKKRAFLKQIAFIMGQRNQLIWDLPAYDSFELQRAVYELDVTEYKKTLNHLLSILECENLMQKPVKTLSLGERMKMELIAGLLHKPKLVFLDEPTIGLDIFSQEAIRTFIREYQQSYKATVILTSHYLEDVKKLTKRLIIIHKGVIVYDGSLKNIIEQYSTEKRIKITLEENISEAKIKAIGSPTSFIYPQLIFSIKRAELPEKIKQISSLLSFSDLTVEDASIEEVIKSFFGEKR